MRHANRARCSLLRLADGLSLALDWKSQITKLVTHITHNRGVELREGKDTLGNIANDIKEAGSLSVSRCFSVLPRFR